MNPVRAGLARRPEDYAWSSARLHLGLAKTDALSTRDTVVRMLGDWRAYLREGCANDEAEMERHLSNGRPFADAKFVARLEKRLTPRPGGRP
ncbi:MAG: transposase, partial [Planctomycetes bacterium]|nr:transposase [Planctomycetota bacterium]